MEKNKATTYIPIQKRKGCQPPIALKVVRFMDLRLKLFSKVDYRCLNSITSLITDELIAYFNVPL